LPPDRKGSTAACSARRSQSRDVRLPVQQPAAANDSGNKVPLFSRPKRPRCVNGSEPCSSECELPCRCDHTLAQAPGVIRATDFKIPAAVSIQHRKQCQLILLADGL